MKKLADLFPLDLDVFSLEAVFYENVFDVNEFSELSRSRLLCSEDCCSIL